MIKDSNNNVINPNNILLHNNETQMIFKNENDASQAFIFDLEEGKIVQ